MATDGDDEDAGEEGARATSGTGDTSDGPPPGLAAHLLDAAVDVVVTADEDRQVVYANPAVEGLFGYAPADVEGSPFASLFPDDMRSRVDETLDRLFDRGDQGCHDVRLPGRHRDGERLRLSVSLFEHGDDGERFVSAVVRDVTDRVQRERRLEEKNERLTRLAGVLSHDLREPLNNANAKLTLARETGDDDYIDDVVRVHERMGDIVDDVLALSTDGLPVEATRPVALGDAVEAARSTVGEDSLDVEVVDSETVVADPDRLQTVFENLLTNATRHAGPDTRVRIGSLEDGGGFYVADDGPGIPAEDRESVFEYGVTDSDDGTGLGLSIVRDVAAAHGWTVEAVESRSGGARFEFAGVEVVEE